MGFVTRIAGDATALPAGNTETGLRSGQEASNKLGQGILAGGNDTELLALAREFDAEAAEADRLWEVSGRMSRAANGQSTPEVAAAEEASSRQTSLA